jgi:hypothetical protein
VREKSTILGALKGDICLTHFSSWSLTDETLNEDAVKQFYSAPGSLSFFFIRYD